MAKVDRSDIYWRGMCNLAEKVSSGQVTQFGGDAASIADLAGILTGMGRGALGGRILKVIQGMNPATITGVEIVCGEVKIWHDEQKVN